jgi:nifR3 family TIM-barrel protein
VKKRMRAVIAARGAEPPGPLPGAGDDWPLARPFRIGDLEIPSRVVQAPLAGIANWAFRAQSRRHGAGLTVSEMIASFGIRYANRKTLGMLTVVPGEAPMGIQVFGADADAMAEAARAVEEAGADLVDVNMGCPVPKICKTGAGAALLADPAEAGRIVEAMVRAVRIPVTVKLRRGLTPATANADETARRLEAAGAAAICIHPRAAAEEYEGLSDHRVTEQVVRAVGIPVIANGDVTTPAEALRVMEETGCAAIAVGRASLGNPWVFGELLRGEVRPRPDLDETVAELTRFAADARAALGEERATGYLRKFYPWYLAGHPAAEAELPLLLTAPTIDAALGRLGSLAALAAA